MSERRSKGVLIGILVQLLAVSLPGAGQVFEGEDVWVFFRDKPDGKGGRIVWQEADSEFNSDALDLPLDPYYVTQIRAAGLTLRFCSRWFNAISVRATSEQQDWLRSQPFVRRLKPVHKFRRAPEPPEMHEDFAGRKTAVQEDYGHSFEQLAQIELIALHNRGYWGQGVRIALLDTGFHYKDHQAFAHLKVLAERDFVNGDDVVIDEVDQPRTGNETISAQNIHGARVLSLLAARDPGGLIGAAPEAEYILAKTEDHGPEQPEEEDRWIAGLEWADSLGADIVNSSLGYITWDDGSGYTYEDLNGETAMTTIAAQMAVRQGVVVVASAGNEGDLSWRYLTVPADAPGVIAVGAVDPQQRIADFSSRGPTADGRIKPDVVAPGEGVWVANIRRGGYARTQGTSFAAPLVSGVCALLLQIHPTWGPEKMLETLRETATDLGTTVGADTVYGWGMVHALRASGLEIEHPEVGLAGDPFPNPATTGTVHFPLQLTDQDEIALRVFDLAGGLVHETNFQFFKGAGQTLRWEIPKKIANGLYFYQLTASTFTRSGKIAVVR